MLKVFSYCSFRLEMHELWSKEMLGFKLGIWLLTTNPLRVKVKLSPIGACHTPWKYIFEGYKILHPHAPNKFDLRKIWMSKVLGQQKSPFWDSYLGVPGKKCHLGIACTKSHRVYYREGSGASSQRLRVI
jgi:hypothetical protein